MGEEAQSKRGLADDCEKTQYYAFLMGSLRSISEVPVDSKNNREMTVMLLKHMKNYNII